MIMRLDLKKHLQILHIDNDEESFEFYTKHFTIEDYAEQWKKGLETLKGQNSPILLPTYIDYDDGMIDVQGYVIYPYGSAWILIDSGVSMSRTNKLAAMHKYIRSIDEELPEDESEWQSHWWLTGSDLSQLGDSLGMGLNFENVAIPNKPLEARSEGGKIGIYADKRCFDIDFGSFKNEKDVRSYAREQVVNFIEKKTPLAIVPALSTDEEMWIYCFFNDNETAYIAQFSMECQDRIADFDAIDRYLRSKDNQPYIIKKDPQVYTMHARFKPDTIGKLLEVL